MRIIGLCGTSGSGKSTVCRIFKEHNISVLDCDEIYHDLVNAPSDCLNAIGQHFGSHLIEGGKLNRKALKEIVFSDSKSLADLNSISHRYVKVELKARLEELKQKNEKICIIDAPMFFEANLDAWCDAVCAVISDPKMQIKRICERDGISKEEAKIRIQKQTSPQILMQRADFIIQNDGNLRNLEEKCIDLIPTLMKVSKAK